LPQYHLYTARDFALDEDFQQWVLRPDVKSNYQWENWLKQYPGKKAVIDEAAALVKSIQFKHYQLSGEQKDALWDAIWDDIATEPVIPELPVRKRFFNLKYAAAVILGIVLATIWLSRPAKEFRAVSMSTATRPGETRRMVLPDSTEVLLNAGSRLVYTQKDKHLREVWLDGEAWFNVRPTHGSAGFIVHTFDHLTVEVLGTQFNVSNRGDNISVALEQGSIKLNIKEQTQLYLQPGEMLRYNKQDGAYAKSKTDVTKVTAWTRKLLMMDEYTVADAIKFMQQVFDKQVTVKDPKMLQYKVSGSMPIVYNADTMLIQFEKAFGVRFIKR
jgi:transmembrane sensor